MATATTLSASYSKQRPGTTAVLDSIRYYTGGKHAVRFDIIRGGKHITIELTPDELAKLSRKV